MILPSEKKAVIIDYLSSYANASMIRYGNVSYTNLYLFNAPFIFFDLFDFQYSDDRVHDLYEKIFLDHENLIYFNKYLEDKEEDLVLFKDTKDEQSFHFFFVQNTIFITYKLKIDQGYQNLFIFCPSHVDPFTIEEIEQNLFILLNKINHYIETVDEV